MAETRADDRRDGPGREVAPQRTAPDDGKAGKEGHEDKYNATRRQKPPPPQAFFFKLCDEEDAEREVRPAEPGTTGTGPAVHRGAHRRRGAHGPVPRFPVPQLEKQPVEMCRQLEMLIPEQATEVPKISSSSRLSCRRRVLRLPQMVEQLVEVPTIVSVSSLRALVEQNVNIQVPHGRGRLVGRRGVSWSRTR